MYNRNVTEKNEIQAFKDVCELKDKEIHNATKELLGEMYYYGNGAEQNYKKALECFKDTENEKLKN